MARAAPPGVRKVNKQPFSMATPNGAGSSGDELAQVLAICNALALKAASGDYIFRGETRRYDDVSSSLYRDYRGVSDIEALQQADLDDARRYTSETDEFTILTELQHYGGHTNLIDFTTDYLIALFFACDGDYSQDGRVVLLERTGEIDEHIYEPRNPLSRVLAQKSVFVRPPQGYVVPSDEVIIPHGIKPRALNYLQKGHGISTETIYNDLHGFIRSKAIHRESFEHFGKAVASQSDGDHQAAIEWCDKALDLNQFLLAAYRVRGASHYYIGSLDQAIADLDRAIDLTPDSGVTFANRGIAYRRKGDFDQAIADFTRAIELGFSPAAVFVNRGIANGEKGDSDQAIADFDRAIELFPDNVPAHVNRGIAHVRKGDYNHAIADYDRAIELDPNDAGTYANLGEAWLHLSEWGKARANLLAARGMGIDIVASFRNDYENVADFERQTSLELPSDIAEMLGG